MPGCFNRWVLTVAFRNSPTSLALESLVQKHFAALERIAPQITDCRVVLELPSRRGGASLHVRVELRVPGHEIVVQRPASPNGPPMGAEAAIRQAFRATELRLQAYLSRSFAHHKP